MTPYYVATGNSFAAKDILKNHGFRWVPQDKKWVRYEGLFDWNGDSAEESAKKARKKIKDAAINCDIEYVSTFTPELREEDPF